MLVVFFFLIFSPVNSANCYGLPVVFVLLVQKRCAIMILALILLSGQLFVRTIEPIYMEFTKGVKGLMFPSIDVLTGTSWDLGTFLKNSTTTVSGWFSLGITLLGIVAVAYAAYQIVTGLMSHGKKQTNWAIAIILLLVGGAISASSGFAFIQGIAGGGKKTIEDLGNGGTILIFQSVKAFLPFI